MIIFKLGELYIKVKEKKIDNFFPKLKRRFSL